MSLKHFFLAALVAVSAVPTVALGQATSGANKPDLTPETKASVLAGVARVIKNQAFVPGIDLTKWDEFIASEQGKIDAAKSDMEFADAVREAISKFGISHMVLITPQAATARIERKAVGIGVSIQPQDDGLLIITVFDNSPAKEAGLHPGDLIMEADGKKLNATSTILGDEGTKVSLKIRHDDGKFVTKTLTRRKFSNVRPETLTWVTPQTAMLKIPSFDMGYDRKRVDALMAEAKQSKNLILDLRSNGGGAVINMLHLLGHLLPADAEFGLFATKSLVNQYTTETNGKATDLKGLANWAKRGWMRPTASSAGVYSGHVAVLVNGGSGSASEITAAALREFAQAPVVGSKSAGAVLVSTMAPLAGGWQLQYPVSDYITAQGVRLEGTGIDPEVVAPMPKYGEADQAIEKALALLKRIELREARSGGAPVKP